MEHVTRYDGVKVPVLGIGTSLISPLDHFQITAGKAVHVLYSLKHHFTQVQAVS